jgi:hypothetical protein
MLLLPLVILASTLYQLALLYPFNVSCGTLLAHGRGSLNCELGGFLSKELVEAGLVTIAERDYSHAYYDSRLTVFLNTIAVVINMFRLPYLLTSTRVVCNSLKL